MTPSEKADKLCKFTLENANDIVSHSSSQQVVQLLLQNPTVRIQNVNATKQKLEKILSGGQEDLHFISDFDMTMSRHWVRNKVTDALERNASSHGIPARYSKMNPEFKAETARLLNKYYPIEIDKVMSYDDKVPYMVEWWQQAHKVIIDQKITHQDIDGMVEEAQLQMRPGVETVLMHCHDRAIPFLVFSAGLANVIQRILEQARLMMPNMHIVSNLMKFNDQGYCDGFEDPLIHVFNKSEFQLESTPYYSTIKDRKNVILMGDSIGDLQMSQGVKHDICLNVGFLNHDIEALTPRYLDAFDIVILGDANMNPIIDLLNHV
ncbi:pyrimidine 5'-nucleotidase-domain-containing protein [Radiomyces spectabilis]|uniref:pyrimidine 5'-nucleotidase-domain-containing protein n=1 Tax=Radiomyces spectabilis TaxID=64574 RepID=UPI00221F2AFD|nr:pyrimidine 5'-nucleotidase-domain-containing protein [Radiomyces spectabilis]KAI8379119.1 pyrimidine 5'-nucleotidase-domain-containing protein [Radiomyces spectabilis]